ncbi:MAG: hypothetical protein ABEH38_05850 [Flavobacteriales bacterium]
MRILLLSFLLFFAGQLFAQEEGKSDSSELHLEAAFFSNTPSFPLSGRVFILPYHPGLDIGVSSPFSIKERGKWEWTASLSSYYHRLSAHAVNIQAGLRYRQTGLRDSSGNGFGWELAFNGGYLHAFGLRPKFELNEETGEYEQVPATGRSQFSMGITTGPAYRLPSAPDWQLFMNYRIWARLPYVAEYVPILPNVAFHLGVRYRIPQKGGSK